MLQPLWITSEIQTPARLHIWQCNKQVKISIISQISADKACPVQLSSTEKVQWINDTVLLQQNQEFWLLRWKVVHSTINIQSVKPLHFFCRARWDNSLPWAKQTLLNFCSGLLIQHVIMLCKEKSCRWLLPLSWSIGILPPILISRKIKSPLTPNSLTFLFPSNTYAPSSKFIAEYNRAVLSCARILKKNYWGETEIGTRWQYLQFFSLACEKFWSVRMELQDYSFFINAFLSF